LSPVPRGTRIAAKEVRMHTIRLLVVSLAVTLVACAGPSTDTTRSAPDVPRPPAAAPPASSPGAPPARTACTTDADCVLVKADCCGCTAGGKASAIPRAEQARYEAALAGRCGDTMCVQVMSNDPSCSAKPRCASGSCGLGR
jgi:hypothetical protein